MLDLRRLKLLSELARRGTIAEVATVVGYTPSAVSQSLAQLEREAGIALLERDGRRVRLTAAARRLVERVDRVLAELDVAEAELAAEQGAVRGEIVIGAFPSAAASIVAPAVIKLRYPELSCAIREHEPEDGLALLRSGELDVLVSESYDDVPPAPAGGLEQHVLLSEPLLLVLPADHPAGEPVDVSTLRDEAWIGGLPGTQYATLVERTCRAAGFAPRIVHRADDAGLLQALPAAGLGVSLLPALARTNADGLRYARVRAPEPRRHVAALVRRGAAARPALAAVLAGLRDAADDTCVVERADAGASLRAPSGTRYERRLS
jgi:DNA-binding transcriptional LysR family regulator